MYKGPSILNPLIIGSFKRGYSSTYSSAWTKQKKNEKDFPRALLIEPSYQWCGHAAQYAERAAFQLGPSLGAYSRKRPIEPLVIPTWSVFLLAGVRIRSQQKLISAFAASVCIYVDASTVSTRYPAKHQSMRVDERSKCWALLATKRQHTRRSGEGGERA